MSVVLPLWSFIIMLLLAGNGMYFAIIWILYMIDKHKKKREVTE